MASTEERVRGIAADVLHVPPERVTLQSSRDEFLNWDSIQHLNLILALEQEFDLQFEPEEMDQMNSLGTILLLVDSKISDSGQSGSNVPSRPGKVHHES